MRGAEALSGASSMSLTSVEEAFNGFIVRFQRVPLPLLALFVFTSVFFMAVMVRFYPSPVGATR